MEEIYSINEILSAIDEIYNKKKVKKTRIVKSKLPQNDFSAVPKSALKLIEEAEKNKD